MDIDLKESEVECEVDEQGENELNLNVEITPDVVQRELERTYDNLQGQVEVPGFRKGNAPIAVIKKKYGQIIKDDMLKQFLQESMQVAVEREEIDLVGEPEFLNRPQTLDADQGLSYTVHLETRPDVEVGDYDEIEVERSPVTVTEEDVEDTIDNLREEHAELSWVEEGSVQKDDVLIADLDLEIDGEEVDTDQNIEVEVNENIRIFDFHHPDLWEKLVGLEAGDSHEVDIEMPDEDVEPERFKGKPATVTLNIHEIKRPQRPEVDQDFAERFECDSVEELREQIREQVKEHKEQQQEEELQQDVLDQLIDRADFEIPDRLLEQGHQRFMEQQKARMSQAGIPSSVIQEQMAEHREESKENIEQRMKQQYVMEEIAEREKIYVTEQEVEEAINQMAQEQDQWPHEFKEQLEENNQMEQLRTDLKEQKVMDFLLDEVSIVEEEQE